MRLSNLFENVTVLENQEVIEASDLFFSG